jgi:hypothetical protein
MTHLKRFKNYSLKKVEKCGGMWGKMFIFAPKLYKIKKYVCVF